MFIGTIPFVTVDKLARQFPQYERLSNFNVFISFNTMIDNNNAQMHILEVRIDGNNVIFNLKFYFLNTIFIMPYGVTKDLL